MNASSSSSYPALGARPSAGLGSSAAFGGLLLLGAFATVAATVFSNGNIAVAVAPIVVSVALAATWCAPLRVPLFMLVFLSLTLDSKNEGFWNSPLEPIGSLLHSNLSKSIPIDALAIPGNVAILALLFLVHAHRSIWRLSTDNVGRTPAADVTLKTLGASFIAALVLCALGVQRGGSLQMAKVQVQTFVLVLVVAYLSAMSLRGLRDYRMLGRLIVAAACIKAVIALYIINTVEVAPTELVNGKMAFATSHGDSMLFACATVMLIARFAESPVWRNGLFCIAVLPLLIGGMVANNRRLVWVEIAATLLTFWAISRRSQLKRFVVRAALAGIPLFVAYVAVGWNSQSPIFAPVRTFRSVGDSQVDASTMYRDLENFNLVATIKANPLIGTGFGHPFLEIVTLPSISFFQEYRYMPHNSVLGLWAFCGPLGFAGLVVALVTGVYLAACGYRHARSPDERTAAFMAIAVVVIFMIHCWGDIGFSERRSMFLVGPALAMAGQLAVSTGAWRMRSHRHSAV